MILTTTQLFWLAKVPDKLAKGDAPPTELVQYILQTINSRGDGFITSELLRHGKAEFVESYDIDDVVEWIRTVYDEMFCVSEFDAQQRTGYSSPSLSRLRKGDSQKRIRKGVRHEYTGKPFSVEGIGWKLVNGLVMYTEQEIQRLIDRKAGRETVTRALP